MTSLRRHLVALALLAAPGAAACSHREAPSSASGFDTSPRAARAYRLRIDAEQAHTERRYADCARLYVELDGLDTPDRDDDELSAGACLARTGDLDGALAHLRTATEHGYRNTAQLSTLDDLKPLRDTPAWHDLVDRTARNRERYLTGANRELYALYAADQADRTGVRYEDVDWAAVSGRDGDRRTRVLELMRNGAAHVAADYLHAAMALQHGNGPDDYQLANQWATEAVRLAPSDPRARWLAVATKDRYLMSIGQPQWYGTQYRKRDGHWTLHDVDPSITDEQRMSWNAPPLDVARLRTEQLDGP